MHTTFDGRLRPKQHQPTDWVDLTKLLNKRLAFVYQRLSSHEQIKRSIFSIKAQDALEDLAKEDGYTDEQVYVENRDLGISGTKGREDRPGLAYLIELVEAGTVESVYVVHISRLYRDQTLINAFALGELFKQQNVIIVTPHMRLNLRDKMHMRLYRMEVERAADELELMAQRLLGAKNLKAKAGYYAGESIPPGYVIDERKQLKNGKPNPDYHTYQVYEPHAEIVRTIFNQLAIPGMTSTRVARYCKEKGITFPSYPPELNTKAHLKTFKRTKRDHDGNWIISVSKVRSIATNPAYIGWKIWEGEVINKDHFKPIINEATFWAVQECFKKGPRPKKQYDPLPLAGLLYCGNHDIYREISYSNNKSASDAVYNCCDSGLRDNCMFITAHILDQPISEAVISQITLPGLAKQVLKKLADEFVHAKEQAASYRREATRLKAEIDNLRNNLAMEVFSADQAKWIDQQIHNRLARITELAELEKQPIGAIGKPMPGQADIELVDAFLNNLDKNWDDQPNGLKNAFLRLLLDKVVIFNNPTTIRATIIWRVGLEQEILINRWFERFSRPKWSETEVEILQQYYPVAEREELLKMLPGRSWSAIKSKAKGMELRRKRQKKRTSEHFTPEEDEIVRRYYTGEIDKSEAEALTGREIESIRSRANRLGLLKVKPRITWEWVSKGAIPEQEFPLRWTAPR